MNYHYNLKTLWNEVVKNYSTNIAIIYDNKSYSYQELGTKAKELEAYLVSEQVFLGDVVAIVNTKSFEDYALMIACLRLGAVYTNIDVDNPSKRIEEIFNLCNPKLVFLNQNKDSIIESCKKQNIKCVNYSKIKNTSLSYQENTTDTDGETIAYIMFTSGSTGIPKGAAITHQNVIHFINWTTKRYNISDKDNFANLSPMYFDNSVFDFYTAFFNGSSFTPIKKELLSKPQELVEYIDSQKCTIWFCVPSLLIYLNTMKVLNKDSLKYIRILTFGGEGYPKQELKKLYNNYSHRIKFINVYGPTECTCICSSYDIGNKDFEDMSSLPSLGKINQNFSYIILDNDGKKSNVGELCLLGPNIGIGYFNDDKRSKKSFSLCLDKRHYSKKMYKTGDIVEEKNNLLFFKGRVDNQIKHMGYRIELEEIEFAINNVSGVNQSAVIYQKNNTMYGKIIAFVAANKNNDNNLTENLKKILINSLPSYMQPSIIKALKQLPKNANGKIDKKSLLTLL